MALDAATLASADDDNADTINIASETLTGDLRDLILDRLKHEQDKLPWNKRSEFDQRATVMQVESAVHSWVKRAVEMIAADGRRTIKAKLDSITVKDGLKAVLTLSQHDALRHALVDSQGKTVLIVVADPEEFEGEREPVEINPDQADLMAKSGAVHSEGDHESPFEG